MLDPGNDSITVEIAGTVFDHAIENPRKGGWATSAYASTKTNLTQMFQNVSFRFR